MRINRRLVMIIVVSGTLAAILSGLLYYVLATESNPVKQVQVPILSVQLEKDSVIQEGNIKLASFNASTVPSGVIMDRQQLIGKKLSDRVYAGSFIFGTEIAERGDVAEPLKGLFIIGIDVNNISNFLGTQLEIEGTYYVLNATGNVEVKVAGIVDTAGNSVFGDRQVPIKTVNLGVKSLEEVKLLKALEAADGIELIKYPDK